MGPLLARSEVPLILMHSRGELADMQRTIRFDDVVREVRDELAASVARAIHAGIGRQRLVVDPGLGFGQTAAQNLRLLRDLPALCELGLPVLVGASRKSFIGHVTGLPPTERLPGSLAAAAWCALGGGALLRVHDVAPTIQFLSVFAAIAESGDAA